MKTYKIYVNFSRNFSLDETNVVQESTTHSMFNNFFFPEIVLF